MQMAVSTISEHLDKLAEAGLIRRMDDGHKWVYYELTPKGEQIISPHRSASVFVFALSVSILLVVFGVSSFFGFGLAPAAGTTTVEGAPQETPKVLAGAPAAVADSEYAKCGKENISEEAIPSSCKSYGSAQGMDLTPAASIGAGAIVLALALYYWKRK
jgi:DNA-binding MarR family transcriptional regulator